MVLSAGNSKAAWGPGDESLFIGLLVRVDKLGGVTLWMGLLVRVDKLGGARVRLTMRTAYA